MTTDPTSFGLPFRRTGSDFETASRQALLTQKVLHVLLSEGEMPWRTAFRAALDQLRHRRTDAVTIELVRVRVRDALARWVPEVELLRVDATTEGNILSLRVDVREGDVRSTVELGVS